MSITLKQILDLVEKLDDSPGDDTPRERFRRFLKENVKEVGQVRDYVEECIRTSGNQYNRALQDLVNYIGHFLGFEVTFGRYQGVSGQIGFDGHWKENPVVIDAALRSKLDAFKKSDPNKAWAWFVQATRKITEHDFKILTRE